MPLFNRTPNVARMKAKHDLKGLVLALKAPNDWGEHALDNPRIRWDAASALVELRDPRSIPLLIVNLSNMEVYINRDVIEILRVLGTPAIDALIAALKVAPLNRASLADRRRIVYLLGELKATRAVDALVAIVNDNYAVVREDVTKALGKIGDARAIGPLVAVLHDTDAVLRDGSALALGELGDPRAVEPLSALLKHSDWTLRSKAAKLLGALGDPQAIRPLLVALGDMHGGTVKRVWGNVWEEVDGEIRRSLERLRDHLGVQPFAALLTDTEASVRIKAVGLLSEWGFVEPLSACLNDADGYVRDVAQRALERARKQPGD